jgi:hypothetical protein
MRENVEKIWNQFFGICMKRHLTLDKNELTVAGLMPCVEGLTPCVECLTPCVVGLTPCVEGLTWFLIT